MKWLLFGTFLIPSVHALWSTSIYWWLNNNVQSTYFVYYQMRRPTDPWSTKLDAIEYMVYLPTEVGIRDTLVANRCNQQCKFSELFQHWGSIQVRENVNAATQSSVENVWERTCTQLQKDIQSACRTLATAWTESWNCYIMHVWLKSLSRQLYSILFRQLLCQESVPCVFECLHHCLPCAGEAAKSILMIQPLFQRLQHTISHIWLILLNLVREGRLYM